VKCGPAKCAGGTVCLVECQCDRCLHNTCTSVDYYLGTPHSGDAAWSRYIYILMFVVAA
jgi:hypothetical protein